MMHTVEPRRHWEHGEDVVERRNATAIERLRRLVYSEEGCTLGPHGLGRVRTLRDYETHAGFDLQRRRAHPDVFTGANPDPVTIRDDSDRQRCLTWEETKERLNLDGNGE